MTKQSKFTVADAIVKELVREGVEAVYGIVSIHNMPIYDAIYREGSIRVVTSRGESGAVNMADAYARATGKIGVVITSTGSGAGNGAGSLVEAWNAGTPLLHLTGEADSHYIGANERYIHEAKNQLQMTDGASKSAYLMKRPAKAAAFVREAIIEAKTAPTGPVTLNIPTNYQAQIIADTDWVESVAGEASLNLTTETIEQIAQAKRPVVWAGNGVIHAGGTEALRQLVDYLQAAVITSENAKGVYPEDHPLCIGNFAATEDVAGLLESSDLLISVGVHFRGPETFDWTLPTPKNHIHIDLDPHAINRSYIPQEVIVADAKLALETMNRELVSYKRTNDETFVEEVKQVKEKVRQDLRNQIGPYSDIAQLINEKLSKDSVLVTDVTIPGYTWGNKLIDVTSPRNYQYMAGGGIGQGLPMAIGAKLGQPDKPVVLIAGDGGFMVNAGEMITATQEEAPVIVLLFDDGGYGILKYYQEAAYGRQTGVDLKNPDFVKLSESMGFQAERVESVDAFSAAFDRALDSGQSYMVVVDVQKIGILEYEDSPEYIASFRPKEQ
ncbi:MAG TPA: thiamine pyrophosphate-binding protein [Pseudogracilibacillus sp.]|nr:thiamine pyrophosphate-binding protein [Pseudogracilibacillus sp.]